jgi:hypothetical protein
MRTTSKGLGITWCPQLIHHTSGQTSGQGLKALRPTSGNYISMCVCYQAGLRDPSPGLPNHEISTASSPAHRDKLQWSLKALRSVSRHYITESVGCQMGLCTPNHMTSTASSHTQGEKMLGGI